MSDEDAERRIFLHDFVPMVCGDIRTMPGLPKVPCAGKIDRSGDDKALGLC